MASQQKKKEYQDYVEQNSPKTNVWIQMGKAFVMGGLICCLGQLIVNIATGYFGLEQETAASWCSMLLILLSAILTGFNLYGGLVKWGGAGALVPITGFANSIVSPAMEYKSEGYVMGVGGKMFTVAGPVLVFGISASIVVGILYLIFNTQSITLV